MTFRDERQEGRYNEVRSYVVVYHGHPVRRTKVTEEDAGWSWGVSRMDGRSGSYSSTGTVYQKGSTTTIKINGIAYTNFVLSRFDCLDKSADYTADNEYVYKYIKYRVSASFENLAYAWESDRTKEKGFWGDVSARKNPLFGKNPLQDPTGFTDFHASYGGYNKFEELVGAASALVFAYQKRPSQ